MSLRAYAEHGRLGLLPLRLLVAEAAEAMAWLKERGIVAPAAKVASEETVTSTSSSESSAAGIVEVLEHRIFMKKEQWRVKWVTGEESWEVLSVLDTDVLRRRAEELASA